MMARAHIASGAVVFLGLGPWLTAGRGELLAGAAVASVSALVPDFDHPHSTAARALGPAHGLASVIARVMGGHRGGTHSLAFAAALGFFVGLFVVTPWVGWAITIGCLAHVAGDCLTPEGCAVLWPLRRTRYRSPVRIGRTGGWAERWLITPTLIGTASWLALGVADPDAPDRVIAVLAGAADMVVW